MDDVTIDLDLLRVALPVLANRMGPLAQAELRAAFAELCAESAQLMVEEQRLRALTAEARLAELE